MVLSFYEMLAASNINRIEAQLTDSFRYLGRLNK
jgi:hypothetical protein